MSPGGSPAVGQVDAPILTGPESAVFLTTFRVAPMPAKGYLTFSEDVPGLES